MLSWRITNGASILTVSLLGFWLIVGSALAQEGASNHSKQGTSGAQDLVIEATRVVDKMKSDPQLLDLMKKAKGVYLVSEFGRCAIIVGGRGGGYGSGGGFVKLVGESSAKRNSSRLT